MLNGTRLLKRLKAAAWVFLPFSLGAQTFAIDTTAIRAHTSVLAHDSLAGRGTGSDGAASAARYIANQCMDLDLKPLGRDFLLPFELFKSEINTSTTSLRVTVEGSEQTFRSPIAFFPNSGRFPAHTEITGRAVFVGDSQQLLRVDRAPPNALAVTLGIPRRSAIVHLASLGFRGAIHLAPNQSTFDLVKQSRGRFQWSHADPEIVSSYLPPIPTFVVAGDVIRVLLRGATGTDPTNIKLNAEIHLTVTARVTTSTVNNVGCVRPGTDRSRVTAFSAHYDHLGVSTPNATGDSIYNGFSDNAAGVAMLLAIAEGTQQAQPRNDIAFLFFTGEERGLLGSDAFVANPPIPLDRFMALINLDAGAPPAPPTTWRIAGDNTALREAAIRAGEALSWTVTTSGPTPNTDYYPFYRTGVPAIFVVPGRGPYEGLDPTQSDALKKRWDAYHQAHDHWHPDFPFSGLERYARYAWGIADAYRP